MVAGADHAGCWRGRRDGVVLSCRMGKAEDMVSLARRALGSTWARFLSRMVAVDLPVAITCN